MQARSPEARTSISPGTGWQPTADPQPMVASFEVESQEEPLACTQAPKAPESDAKYVSERSPSVGETVGEREEEERICHNPR
jgi:hypothetical protein